MMWSDMWFRIGGGYLKAGVKVPKEVAKRIPRQMQLVYWDYYQYDPAQYEQMIDGHRAMGKEPIFAPGLWTDYVFWSHFSHARIDTYAGMIGRMTLTLRNPEDIAILEEQPETTRSDILEPAQRRSFQVREQKGPSVPQNLGGGR